MPRERYVSVSAAVYAKLVAHRERTGEPIRQTVERPVAHVGTPAK